ncbi:M56 family metallopeptidase [Shewanella rhizosphaerae]|uniref:M56 family metallopeptidase n=1 Tax=Shewanella rhizosphaerae TaxID=2864207 RepID=UPI001C65612B|nr:M56 family metallopeptidase [Shewanella rhizosphaerae]QYK12141.1 M56 family metallopeptidase [Shewanella rhizosphaerae]
MISLIINLMLPLTLLCAVILLLHRPLLARLGAHNTYMLWASVPLLLAGTLLGLLVPARLASPSLEQLQHYRVLAGELLSQGDNPTLNLILASIWLLGSLALLGALLYQATQLKRLSNRAEAIELPQATSERPLPLTGREASLVIKCHPEIDSPMLAGLFKPVVLVPTGFTQLALSQQAAVLSHELKHLTRHDIAANLFGYLLATLFWFNPVCWLAYRRFRDDQELACDAEVTTHMDKQQRIAYSQTLLAYSQQAHLGMLHTHYGNKTILKERIMQMKKTHTKRPLAILGLALTLGLSGALINQSAIAGDKHNDKHQEKAKAPSPVMRIEPAYPAEAAKQSVEGYVQLAFDIDKQGKVSNVSVIESSPAGVFDVEAVKALSQWRYEASPEGVSQAKVQLDFMMSAPKAEIERVRVTAG